jgi:hypothetical protein
VSEQDPMKALASALAGSQATSKQAQQPSSFAICTIEDCFAHTGLYIVRLPAGRLVTAADLHHSSCMPLGARPASCYMPKSRVMIAAITGLPYAVILGAVPKELSDPNLVLPESLVLRSMVGVFQDPLHYSVFSSPNSDMTNHSAGRPADILSGDWGSINDLGVAVFIGRLMATIKASDGAKMEAFWGDDLLRLVGYNFELFTAGAEERRINDEGEYNEIRRMAMFPWEGLGLSNMGNATMAANGRLMPDSAKAKYEPKQDDQLMIQRVLQLRGYLGDLDREFVCTPPPDTNEQYTTRTRYNGLLDILKSSTGAITIRSAKEIVLEKYALIPVPKEMIAPEDPLGDSIDNYKAGDLQGGGSGYQMPEYVWGDDQNANIRSAQLFDQHAYLIGKYSYAPADAHKKDWYVPEESEINTPVSSTVYDKSLRIGYQFMAALPGFGELVIDQRPGHTARYYRSRSCIHQLDDGSIVIEDGYGSQIAMKGGSIFLTCVGDIWAQPGRNFIAWAPHDAILRAGNSADISASKHDVRIKAERNMHILAGNDQSKIGGILLESRSEGPSLSTDWIETGERVESHGITLKSAKSSVQLMGKDVYVGRNQQNAGTVVIDGGKEGNLYLRGREILSRANSLLALMVESDASTDKQMFALNISGAVISAPTQIGGTLVLAPTGNATEADLIVSGNLLVHEGIAAGKGGIVTNGGFAARTGAPNVGKLNNDITLPDPSLYTNNIEQEVTLVDGVVQAQEQRSVLNSIDGPGNDDFQRAVGFSCRDTTLDIKLDSSTFLLYEARWQQMLRQSGNLTFWDEPLVLAPNGDFTRPHPGQDGWTLFDACATVNATNFELTVGRAIARDGMTEQGQTPNKLPLQSGYVINIQGV